MKSKNILEEITGLYEIRKNNTPLIHAISNMVTMNDVAQTIIYSGAKPIMAHFEEEVEYITSSASALVINLGTLDGERIKGIKKAANIASEKGIPVVLDPVGIQVSSVRMELARNLLEEAKVSVLKGNYSEIKSIINLKSSYIGIDSLDEEINDEAINKLRQYSKLKDLNIILTGKEDYIIHNEKSLKISNGTPLLSRITGSGCIVSGILGALCGKVESIEEIFYLCAYGLMMISVSGEKAAERLREDVHGLYTFKNYFMDELSLVCEKDILERGMIRYV